MAPAILQFLLQLKKQSSDSKSMCGFPIISIQRGIVTVSNSQRVKESMLFVE